MPIIDEIHEEIKREDFFNRLRKFLPFALIGAILILLGAGIYVWRSHAADKRLAQQEAIYERAVAYVKQGEFLAADALLDELIQTSQEMKWLAKMQKGRIYQTRSKLTDAKKDLEKVRNFYDQMTKEYPSKSLESALVLIQAFFELDAHLPSLSIAEKVQSLMSPRRPWYPLAATYFALNSDFKKDPEKAKGYFKLWNQVASQMGGPMSWLARYAMVSIVVED